MEHEEPRLRRHLHRADPVRHRTGASGQGQGHLCLRLRPRGRHADPASSSPRASATRPTCASIATAAILYCVNEFKEYEGKPSGAVSAFRIDQKTGALTWLNTQALARHRPLPPDRRPLGPLRADRQLRLRLDLRAADPRRTARSARRPTGSSTRGRASIRGGRPARTPTPSTSPPTAASPTSRTSGSTR